MQSISVKYVSISVLCATTLLLQGCGNKVDCNSSKVKEDAIEIIQSHLNAIAWYNDIHAAISGEPELTSIKTLSRNDDLKQGQCSAKYTFTYNKKPREIEVGYSLAYLQDKGETEVKVVIDDVKGGIMSLVMSERPVKDGVEKIIDQKTGNLQQKIEWKDGVEDGVEEIYNPATNQLIAKIHVEKGRKAGSEKRWNADGTVLLIDLNWVDGKATGFQKVLDKSGTKILTDLIFKDGRATGFQTTGNLDDSYVVDNYKDGKLDGRHQEIESGKVVKETNFRNGVEEPINPPVQALSTKSMTFDSASMELVNNLKKRACVDSKIDEFHKKNGIDALIASEILSEWESGCIPK